MCWDYNGWLEMLPSSSCNIHCTICLVCERLLILKPSVERCVNAFGTIKGSRGISTARKLEDEVCSASHVLLDLSQHGFPLEVFQSSLFVSHFTF